MSLSQSWRIWYSICPSLLVNFSHKISMLFWSAVSFLTSLCLDLLRCPYVGAVGWFCCICSSSSWCGGQCGMFFSWRQQGCKKECPTHTGTYSIPKCVMLLISHWQNKSQGRTQSQGKEYITHPSLPTRRPWQRSWMQRGLKNCGEYIYLTQVVTATKLN